MDALGTLGDLWGKYTPAGIIYNKSKDTIDNVTKPICDAFSLIKKYWYVPVIVGGVIVGWRVISTVKTGKLLANIAKR